MEMLKKSVIAVLLFLSLLIFGVITLIIFRKCCFSDYCEIPLSSHDESLVLARRSEGKFLYPKDGDSIIVDSGESFILGCPGSKLNVDAEYSRAQCLTETNFQILGDNEDITSLFCEDASQITARYTGKGCENGGQEIEIGFDFGDFFLRQIRVCFDEKEQNTLYSEHNLTNYIIRHEQSGRPLFVQGNFYDLKDTKLDVLYSRKVQRATINEQLSLASDSDTIIKNGSSFFLSRGHLSPRGDFFYSLQMNASFFYVNSAPQWSIINSLGWNDLEKAIRSFATERKTDLQIFTGTYGKLQLSSKLSNQLVPLYLYYQNSSKAVPIPEIFWKVIFDPISKMGISFVGSNNPYLKKNEMKYLCNDISDQITWTTLNKNTTRGFIYACDVKKLRSIISYIPDLDITSLLTK